MKITKTIERDVEFAAIDGGTPKTWRFAIGPVGIHAWPVGERTRERRLTWKEILSTLVIHGRTVKL